MTSCKLDSKGPKFNLCQNAQIRVELFILFISIYIYIYILVINFRVSSNKESMRGQSPFEVVWTDTLYRYNPGSMEPRHGDIQSNVVQAHTFIW